MPVEFVKSRLVENETVSEELLRALEKLRRSQQDKGACRQEEAEKLVKLCLDLSEAAEVAWYRVAI